MKKVVSVLLIVALLASMTIASLAAPEYGSEWSGYEGASTQKYSDVPETHWAFAAINRASEKNWFGGYPDGTFRPNASITRAEALKVFVMFLGLDYLSVDLSDLSYTDVYASDWYAPYIEAGKDLFPVHTNIQGKTPFQPKMPVTREDTIYALVKALGCDVGVKYPDQSVLNMFKDANSISANIKSIFSIALMPEHQLVSGFPDGTIRAQAALTRAEFATLLLRGTEHGFHDKYEAKIEKVTVSPASPVEIEIGESVTLSARATYTDGTNKPYTSLQPYDAENNGVISLSGTTFTGLKEGTTTIKYNDSYLKKDSLTVIVKKPTGAPKIKVTDYPEITDESSVTISGTVIDKNVSTVDFTCNSKDVLLNADGSFTTIVSLRPGKNTIKFTAVNEYKMSAEKTIEITRNTAPAIFITKYDERTTASKTTVEGIVSDSDISTVKLTCNGAAVSMKADGSFVTEVSLKMGENPFTFAATNVYGKTAQQTIKITQYEEDSKIVDVPDEVKTDGKVELAFVIDATGSMWDEIGNVKTNINAFAKYLESMGVDLKMSVVEYRDITCDEPTKVHKYSGSTWHTTADELVTTLASIDADGGGDAPESVLDGFGHVLDNRHMSWSGDAFKFAVLLTDASYKTENTYDYTSLDEIANELASIRMTTSVITSTGLFDTYKVLSDKTGGLQLDIRSDFSVALSELADKIVARAKK